MLLVSIKPVSPILPNEAIMHNFLAARVWRFRVLSNGYNHWCTERATFQNNHILMKDFNCKMKASMPTLDQLSGSKRFSTLDLQSGYWQVTISPEDREKKKWVVVLIMPLGLYTAPVTFG